QKRNQLRDDTVIHCRLSIAMLGCAVMAALASSACSPRPQPTNQLPSQQATSSSSGSLTVLVRPPDRTIEPVPITDPGALPVQSDRAMTIDVELDEPACIYLVWIDSVGHLLPLYRWNNETLEIKYLSQPPPLR